MSRAAQWGDYTVYRLKTCPMCQGDLFHEDEEWRCFQCGHYYYMRPLDIDASSGQRARPAASAVGAEERLVEAPRLAG